MRCVLLYNSARRSYRPYRYRDGRTLPGYATPFLALLTCHHTCPPGPYLYPSHCALYRHLRIACVPVLPLPDVAVTFPQEPDVVPLYCADIDVAPGLQAHLCCHHLLHGPRACAFFTHRHRRYSATTNVSYYLRDTAPVVPLRRTLVAQDGSCQRYNNHEHIISVGRATYDATGPAVLPVA